MQFYPSVDAVTIATFPLSFWVAPVEAENLFCIVLLKPFTKKTHRVADKNSQIDLFVYGFDFFLLVRI